MNNHILLANLALGSALLLASPGSAQIGPPAALFPQVLPPLTKAPPFTPKEEDDTVPPATPSPELQKRIRALMEGVLPKWDKRLLTAYETPDPWEDNLNHRFLGKLLQETPFDWEGKTEPPLEADRLVDESKSMRIRRAEGDFRYQSRKRVFTPDLKGKPAPSPDRVARQLESLLGNLKFPLLEADKPDVQTQEVALSDEDGKLAERFPAYAFYQMQRQIEGVPVEGSTVRAAVNLRGEVQRLKIAWPHFRLKAGAELLPRERVVEEAVQKVLAQDPTEKLELASRLVYARTDKGEFLPAVQVDISDGETPYRLTLPIAR